MTETRGIKRGLHGQKDDGIMGRKRGIKGECANERQNDRKRKKERKFERE